MPRQAPAHFQGPLWGHAAISISQLSTTPRHHSTTPTCLPVELLECLGSCCNDNHIPNMGFDPQYLPAKAKAGAGAEAAPVAASFPRTQHHELQVGPYALRTLLEDVPLSEDGDNANIKINCVDYLGRESLNSGPPFQRKSELAYADLMKPQAATCTLARLPPSSSTLSKFHLTLPTLPDSPSSSSPQDYDPVLPRALSRATPSQASSKSSCCPESRRHASCATTL